MGDPMVESMLAFYGGKYKGAHSGATLDAINPATGELLGRFPRFQREDANAAVTAALEAFQSWKKQNPRDIATCLLDLAARVEADRERLVLLDVRDNGSPLREMAIDIDIGVSQLRYFAGLALQVKGETSPTGYGRLNFTLRQPFGVTAQLIPFNHPLMFALKTIGAPLICGNTVIVKPSEHTSLSALALVEHIKGVFPPGVVNIITGLGKEVGDALVTHPDVRRIHFIGSDAVGRMIQARAATAAVKTVTLELGGKNPIVIWPDADKDAAMDGALKGMRFNFQGQACGSTSRLLLPREMKDEFLTRLAHRMDALKVGLPEDRATDVGAIVNRQQLNRVLEYIAIGRSDGGRVLAGGNQLSEGELARGFFVRPTLLSDIEPKSRLLHEEVFGPVLAAMVYEDYEDAIRLANLTHFGLTASIYTKDLRIAHRFSRDVEAGYVWVNDNQSHFLGAPYGGGKDSGLGREEDLSELLSYTQVKNVNINFG
jgi:acyl-CoA reductase-like NAD-dependent aldehyde dehydrogenase